MTNNIITDFKFLIKTLKSCKTTDHLLSTRTLMENFNCKWEKSNKEILNFYIGYFLGLFHEKYDQFKLKTDETN